jgi:hypothetical protein
VKAAVGAGVSREGAEELLLCVSLPNTAAVGGSRRLAMTLLKKHYVKLRHQALSILNTKY